MKGCLSQKIPEGVLPPSLGDPIHPGFVKMKGCIDVKEEGVSHIAKKLIGVRVSRYYSVAVTRH